MKIIKEVLGPKAEPARSGSALPNHMSLGWGGTPLVLSQAQSRAGAIRLGLCLWWAIN